MHRLLHARAVPGLTPSGKPVLCPLDAEPVVASIERASSQDHTIGEFVAQHIVDKGGWQLPGTGEFHLCDTSLLNMVERNAFITTEHEDPRRSG